MTFSDLYKITFLFSDDVRHEQDKRVSLVGVLPLQINVETIPFILPKLGFYCQIVAIGAMEIESLILEISGPTSDSSSFRADIPNEQLKEFKTEMLKKAESGFAPGALVVAGAVVPYKIESSGEIQATLSINGNLEKVGTVTVGVNSPERISFDLPMANSKSKKLT